jgi:hypothetical protein
MRKVLVRVLLGGVALLLLAQLVPYGWWHENPPVTQAAAFPSTEAEAIARGACMDCHSNETDWPPYSYVAPMSWLVRRDVERGREAFNLSELDREQEADFDDAADEVEDGSMPPRQYELAHPDARLSDDERQVLIEAFEAMDDGAPATEEDDRSGSNRGSG